MNIYIMRHGETYWNSRGLIQGSSDIELTPYGIELAEHTRDGLKRDGIQFDRIYTSPYIRAVKTAEIINEKQNAPVITDLRIREMCFGMYEGKNIKEITAADSNIRNCFSVPSRYQASGDAETFEAVYKRADDFMQNELKPLEGLCNTVLIVCHGAFIRAVLTRIRQMDLDEFWNIRQPNCCVNLLTLKNGTFTVEKENILYYEMTEELAKRGIV